MVNKPFVRILWKVFIIGIIFGSKVGSGIITILNDRFYSEYIDQCWSMQKHALFFCGLTFH